MLYELRKNTGITKTGLEILSFASYNPIFTAYQATVFFRQANVQHIRNSIKHLVDLKMLELIGQGYKNKPNVYALTIQGEKILNDYLSKW